MLEPIYKQLTTYAIKFIQLIVSLFGKMGSKIHTWKIVDTFVAWIIILKIYWIIRNYIYQTKLIMSNKIVIGYWGFRGRAQPVRHLAAYLGLEFEEKIYTQFPQYFQEKFNLGIPFPNLPYALDGDLKITQTLAIMRYLAKKAGKPEMNGKTPQDAALIDMGFYIFWEDIIGQLVLLLINKKVNDVKVAHYYQNKAKYQKFEKQLAGKQYAIGYITIVDFLLAEGSFYLEKLYPEEYVKYPNLHKIRQNIQNLPQVQAYYKRQKHVLTPFMSPNITAIPFYYPGTEPINAPPPPVLSPTKSSTSKKTSNFYKPANKLNLLVISGSLDQTSPISTLLKAIASINHPGFNIQWADISSLELHRFKQEGEGTENVNKVRKQVDESNGVLIGVAETHNNITPCLVNAFNWLANNLKTKRVGLVSFIISENRFRNVLQAEGIEYLQKAEMNVQDKEFFDKNGKIVSEVNIEKTVQYLNCLAEFIEKK